MALAFQHGVSLKTLNTFGVDARATHFAVLADIKDLTSLLASNPYQTGPVLWLGGGSNILFTRDFVGLVVYVALNGIHVVEDFGESIIVEAAAGENWHNFVRYTLKMGWYGLENLSLIPGTVGACPVQNIGAYGVEVKEYIAQVICADLTRTGACRVMTAADCNFGYRDSIFKHTAAGKLLITAVRFHLSRTPNPRTDYDDVQRELVRHGKLERPTPEDVSDAITRIRLAKLPDPAQLGNAGSFFKNPVICTNLANILLARYPDMPHYTTTPGSVKLAAGWLIDQMGLKGYREGDAGIYERQALILVNHGTATGEALKKLADKVGTLVTARYGVTLEAEPLIL